MRTAVFGTLDGHQVEAVELVNGATRARLITYGARLTELWVPDASGALADIVLGYDDLESYVASGTYFGATCGQYANRIAEGRCRLEGRVLQLDQNDGAHHLHGGTHGVDRKIWRIAALDDHAVSFTTWTEAGEMGFPGRSALTVRYAINDEGTLEIEMTADTDAVTLMNLAHHSYFNLAGQGSVLDHRLQIPAAFYTPVDDELLATGEIRSVAETPFDFRHGTRIGRHVETGCDAPSGAGYDHNWCLGPKDTMLRPAAVLHDPGTGRRLHLSTTEPGLQVYTGGGLSDQMVGKGGRRLDRFAGVALETQKYPGTPTFSHFPNAVLRPGDVYRHRMMFRFDAVDPAQSAVRS